MPNKIQKTRGPQKFASLTYPVIAEMTDYSIHTIRGYAQQGLFDPDDIDGTLRWINARRLRLGLPMVGVPDGEQPIDGTLRQVFDSEATEEE